MADMNDPPPLFSSEGDLNSKEDDDIFASTVEQHKNFREGPMEGPAVEEVNLDEDEPQTQAPLLGSAKLEFRGSDEELSAPNPPRGATTLFSPDAGAKPQTGGKEKEKPEELLEISVREPQKVGEGMGAFVSYRVVTRTNLSYFRKSQMSVSRRFSDFLGLHEKLVEKHLHLGRIVPPVPEKSVLEPAILVMYHSMRPHPAITATLLDFLCRIMSNFCKSLAAQVKVGIYTSLRQILEKRVLASLSPLFDNPKLDKELRAMIREQFTEFCSPVEGKVEDTVPMPPGSMILDGNHNSVMNCENEAQFSEDEDDIPLGKLRSKDIKFQPIREPSKAEQMDISEHLNQLGGEIRKKILELQNEKNSEVQCEIVEGLLQEVLREEDFDQDTATSIGTCLAQILDNEFTRKLFPQELDDESIEESIGTPLFVIFRNLCQTPEEDPSRQAQLMLLWELGQHQPRLGYRLLYFLRASFPGGTGGGSGSGSGNGQPSYTSYRDYARSHHALNSCLLQDLRLCQEDDVRLFCYLVPEIYTQFPNVAIGNADILNLIVSCIDALQLQDLVCHILQGNMVMFRKDSFISILNASLEWETFEQFCLWQLIAAHNIPVDYVLPILPKLEFQAHAEALTSILLLLKQEKPSAELLRHILCRDVKGSDLFVVSILKYWTQEHEVQLSELVGALFVKAGSAAKRKRQPLGSKNQGPAPEQTLAHLDQLRQHCRQTSFFSQGAIQAALAQVQASSTEAQKTKFSDLFALADDAEELKLPQALPKGSSGAPSRGNRGGGKAGGTANTSPQKSARVKPVLADSDSSTESSEDEEAAKPKPPRKKKKTALVTSDSD
ncbi:integrator complex subunit 3 [Ixodes scapularis]